MGGSRQLPFITMPMTLSKQHPFWCPCMYVAQDLVAVDEGPRSPLFRHVMFPWLMQTPSWYLEMQTQRLWERCEPEKRNFVFVMRFRGLVFAPVEVWASLLALTLSTKDPSRVRVCRPQDFRCLNPPRIVVFITEGVDTLVTSAADVQSLLERVHAGVNLQSAVPLARGVRR